MSLEQHKMDYQTTIQSHEPNRKPTLCIHADSPPPLLNSPSQDPKWWHVTRESSLKPGLTALQQYTLVILHWMCGGSRSRRSRTLSATQQIQGQPGLHEILSQEGVCMFVCACVCVYVIIYFPGFYICYYYSFTCQINIP